MRVIDAFNHVLPARYYEQLAGVIPDKNMAKRIGQVKLLHDIEGRMRMMDQWPGTPARTSPPVLPEFKPWQVRTRHPELARLANDGLAESCVEGPTIPASGCRRPARLDASLKEIDWAIN